VAGVQQFLGAMIYLALGGCLGIFLCVLLWPFFSLPFQLLYRWRYGPPGGSVWLRFYLGPPRS